MCVVVECGSVPSPRNYLPLITKGDHRTFVGFQQQSALIVVSATVCLHHCVSNSLPSSLCQQQSALIVVSATVCLHHCVSNSLPSSLCLQQSAFIIVSATSGCYVYNGNYSQSWVGQDEIFRATRKRPREEVVVVGGLKERRVTEEWGEGGEEALKKYPQ
ncbi:hypothetical protein Hamer_G017762, partial [Homarus americanus]